MHVRHIYLKIETIPNYNPVAPDDAEHHKQYLEHHFEPKPNDDFKIELD